MPKISKISMVVLIIIICLGVVFGVKFCIGISRDNLSEEGFTKMKGGLNAPIKITEFIDFQCPACAKGAKYLKEMIQKYPQAIRLEVKHYPLQMHRHGYLSSQFAECSARQGKFWLFQDMLLARQENWMRLTDAKPAFEDIANDNHLNNEELNACLQDEAVDKVIEKNKAEGESLGVKSTPTYIVNGKIFVGKKSLSEEISRLLEKNGY